MGEPVTTVNKDADGTKYSFYLFGDPSVTFGNFVGLLPAKTDIDEFIFGGPPINSESFKTGEWEPGEKFQLWNATGLSHQLERFRLSYPKTFFQKTGAIDNGTTVSLEASLPISKKWELYLFLRSEKNQTSMFKMSPLFQEEGIGLRYNATDNFSVGFEVGAQHLLRVNSSNEAGIGIFPIGPGFTIKFGSKPREEITITRF